MIGHNPGLHELAMALAGIDEGIGAMGRGSPMARRLAEGYPTGALVEFSIASPWHLLEPGGGQLIRFIQPRDLLAADTTETIG